MAKVVSIGECIQFEPRTREVIMPKPMTRPIPNIRKNIQATRKQPRPYT